MKLIIDAPDEIVEKGFEGPLTDEERQILIRAIGNGTLYKERPRGEWSDLSTDGRHTGWIYCTVCGHEPPNESNLRTDFCPNCGADLRKGSIDCMDEDAKQASIPYTYNAPQHDWKCGYPDITRGKGE